MIKIKNFATTEIHWYDAEYFFPNKPNYEDILLALNARNESPASIVTGFLCISEDGTVSYSDNSGADVTDDVYAWAFQPDAPVVDEEYPCF